MTIYDRIKQLRIQLGMSQFDLAKKVGYEGRSAISKVEKGERDISQSMIIKYATALGVTPTYLLYGDDEEISEQEEVSHKKDTELIDLISRLTEQQKSLIIAQIKGILSSNGEE